MELGDHDPVSASEALLAASLEALCHFKHFGFVVS